MSFDLTDLRLFLLVVEAGSMTHGAAQAHLSLPSASARLRGMEERIGHPLLERSPRGVKPTPAGEALAHHARIVLRQIDRMRGELGEYAKGVRAHIRLLANTAAAAEFLPQPLADFLKDHPHIDIDLQERLSTEIVKAVAGSLADIGVVSEAVDTGSLQLIPFAIDRIVVIVPSAHALATRHSIAFQDILGHDFVGLSVGSALQDYLGEHAKRAGQPLSYRIRLRNFEGICKMVAKGVGIGLVPETVVGNFADRGAIQAIRLSDTWATRQLSLCVRDLDSLSPQARELVRHLAGASSSVAR
jgi:DNA-binding transcriptional LysR family regulator